MQFQMWMPSIVGSVLNANSISTSTVLVLIVTLSVHFTKAADQHIDGTMVIANHTTNAITPSATADETEPNPMQNTMSSTKVLSRRKRFIAFPEGSSFSVSCLNAAIEHFAL